MKEVTILGLLLGLIFFLSGKCLAVKGPNNSDLLRVYEVNKKVFDFPDKEDFSTPEAAYAVINRVMASGKESVWREISIKELEKKLPTAGAKIKEVKLDEAKMWRNAKILEVRIFKNRYAVVIAEISQEGKSSRFDQRAVNFENGKWLNAGQSMADSLDTARNCAKIWSRYADKPKRSKIDDPNSYIKPFVEFLKTNGREPKEFVINALAQHKLVIMGETHHRPWYWTFNSELVTHPDFAKNVGTIYMELPSNDQELVDNFLAAKDCNTIPIIEMLRDNLWTGWPDQPMLDFFVTVWKINLNLKPEQKLRIMLVDMQRPWKKIQKREDWRQYDVDRNKLMTDNIIRYIHEHPLEKRDALFIVGVAHTALNLKYFEGSPVKMAGWYLRNELGPNNVYAIFQHRCAETNVGQVEGRLCLGLFDSAFAATGNKKIAFSLDTGPFGKQLFDAFPDEPPMLSSYGDGYNAYLYFGPLEDESFSPLIPGFYTDDFVKELERRHNLMFGKGWAETYRIKESSAASFINWMSGSVGSWGKPRKWRNQLGPINAWKYGDKWKDEIQKEKYEFALKNPEIIKSAAKRLFDSIRNADYQRYKGGNWSLFPALQQDEQDIYEVARGGDEWVRWICETFEDNPIESIELGEVFKGKDGLPTISYKLTLRNGKTLKGNLPFEYQARGQYWMGIQGIDWHLTQPLKEK